LALRLIDRGARLIVVTPYAVDSYNAFASRRLGTVRIRPAPSLASAAAISPDGRTVAIGSQTGTISFMDVATGAAVHGRGGHSEAIAATMYAPQGRSAISVGDDGRVIVWDPGAGTEQAMLPGPPEHVDDAQVSPDGSTLYTAGVGGVLLVWDLTGTRSFGRSAHLGGVPPCCDPISPSEPALALSPDGSRFAVPIAASTIGVFSTATLQRRTSFTISPPDDPITALAWSPAGELAVGGHGGTVQLWDVSGAPRLERSLLGLEPFADQPDAIQALAFSPDGQLLAASDKRRTTTVGHALVSPLAMMVIWRVRTGGVVAGPISLGASTGLSGSDVVAFSRNGRLLAASLLTGGVRLFDPATGRVLRTLTDPGDDSISLAFAPNGTLATGTLDDTVEMWNPTTGKREAPPLLADSSPITDVAFDPSGSRFVATGYGDGAVRMWFTGSLEQEGPRMPADPDTTAAAVFEPGGNGLLLVDNHGDAFSWPTSLTAWERQACALAGRNLTRTEWRQFVGEPRYSTICR
jgi:WD40 repeat protein